MADRQDGSERRPSVGSESHISTPYEKSPKRPTDLDNASPDSRREPQGSRRHHRPTFPMSGICGTRSVQQRTPAGRSDWYAAPGSKSRSFSSPTPAHATDHSTAQRTASAAT